jgi:MPBQ/MSBQ methyltransferase
VLGDAESLPFEDDAFDRYVSAGSIEYWPDPQRGIAEAYRVTKEGGVATVIGPVRPANKIARYLAETWMLFPGADEYERWFRRAGFRDVRAVPLAPDWYRDERGPYALAVSGTKPSPGKPLTTERTEDPPAGPLKVAARFIAGSLAGLAFVPIAIVLTLRRRRGHAA